MTSRIQANRFAATTTRPSTLTRPPGEFWLNFPDLRFGMIDTGQAAVDLLAVRNYAATATYAVGDHAVYSGTLQRAKVAIPPGTYDATKWDPLVTQSFTDGLYTTQAQNDARYVKLAGSTMTGYLTLSSDPIAPLNASTKQYTDAADALKLNLSGGTMTGPLVLAGNPTAPNQAANKGYVDTLVGNYLPLTGGVLSGTLRVSNGRLISSNSASNPSVTVWDTNQGYAAGMFLGSGNTLYFAQMDGAGAYSGNWYGYFDNGGNLHARNNIYAANDIHAPHFYADSTLGVQYTGIGSHWFAFGWNGNLQCYVDGGYQFDLASTTWANATFATYGWSNGQFLFKSGDTCTGNLNVNGTMHAGVVFSNGNVHCQNDPNAWFGVGGSGRVLVFSGGAYYWDFDVTNGTLQYMASTAPFWVMRNDALCLNVRNSVAGNGAYWDFSDERFKEHIEEAKTGLAAICALRPITFRRKPSEPVFEGQPVFQVARELGFSAQQVREVIPEAVTTLGINQPDDLGVSMTAIVAALVKAVQELAAR